jgi:transmembrane sensor
VGTRRVAHADAVRPASADRRPWAGATRAARLRVAAGVLAACGAGGAAAWRLSSARGEGWATWPWTRTPAERVYVTAPGQRATVLLADGTRVELGVASTLRVRRPGATEGPREVDLAGDAVFTVMHDARRPFRVWAGHAVAEDLGTVFGVRAYPDEPRVRVVVVAGVVALRARAPAPGGVDPAARTAVLGADDVGVVDAAGTTVTTRVPGAAALLGWTAGRITVRDARLDEVARELGRWFDTPVRVPDSAVAARRLTLDLPARSLDAVLDAVAVLGDVRVRRTPGGVLLVPAAAPDPVPSP